MATLDLDQVTVRYGRRGGARPAVDAATATFGPGLHALLGPNGAGKSSLIRTIATLQKPSSGSVTFGGSGEIASIRRHLGHLPQENLGKSRFTVREHFAYMAWLRRLPKAQTEAEVDRVIGLVRLGDRADTKIRALSGGMRRRVGIGSALIGQPGLVILDEPSAGLDVVQRGILRDITREVSRDAVVLVSTHIIEDILDTADTADTVTVIDTGRIVWAGERGAFAPGAAPGDPGNLAAFERRSPTRWRCRGP
ncbi:ATP-binding cassette domain-containing protein [uncultured Corynebacterium sp.]|uniref:ATP-binding cassette domain-containing protein n=1 Tax=uncultured Corynebacterium sp. TaxID=159447 RepID=UPI0025D9D5ED|nr:ATP-binding cassette domain-containing protein [uncultured Corynebacterium sp.]